MSEANRSAFTTDPKTVEAELKTLDEVSERVRLAGLALATPLAGLRQGQMEREAARAAARNGADDPETVARLAALGRATVRFDQLRNELVQARVTPTTPKDGQAAISGVIVRTGQPVADATVSLLAGGQRQSFVCSNAAGGFGLDAPADTGVLLSVTLKEGGEAFRDKTPTTLKAGQAIFRYIELDGADPPCPDPSPVPPPDDTGFPMVQLVGQLEADARKLIAAQGLVLGDRSEKADPQQVGQVIDQTPTAGTKVKAGDSVSIVVATDGQVEVPQVLGLTEPDARLVLAKSELSEGKLTRTPSTPDMNGRVVAQSPKPGERAARKSAVDLEIGVGKSVGPQKLDADVARVADLASHRLGETGAPADGPTVSDRLATAGVIKMAALDKLVEGDREAARKALDLRTLADTDRTLSALRQARKELGG